MEGRCRFEGIACQFQLRHLAGGEYTDLSVNSDRDGVGRELKRSHCVWKDPKCRRASETQEAQPRLLNSPDLSAKSISC
jgi:hypothetical protein